MRQKEGMTVVLYSIVPVTVICVKKKKKKESIDWV